MDRAMTAREVLDTYWDGTLPVPLIAIANAMGIRVFKQPGLDCSGKVSLVDGSPRIEFNPDEPAVRQRFTIAHEIGHVALGHLKQGEHTLFRDEAQDFFASTRDPREVQANKFAARLLMPAESVRTAFFNMGSTSLQQMADLFNVSTVAMRYRLINLGLIRG